MQKKPQISIIIVNYRSAEYLQKCLMSLRENIADIPYEIIVVDNGRENLAFVSKSFGENTSVHVMKKNIGFGRACNYGSKKAQAPFFAFINPDSELRTKNIKSAVERLETNDEVEVIGAKLLSSFGDTQEWSTGKQTSLWDIVLNNIGITRSATDWRSLHEKSVDWVSGAALFISAKAFRQVKGFDERYFMYFEDQDLCTRIRKQGYKVRYFPQVQFAHKGSASFGQEKKKQKQYYYRSQNEFLKEHCGKRQAQAAQLLRKIFIRNAGN